MSMESAACKAFIQKERVKFLKNCLNEKVVPRSQRWILRIDPDNPFPPAAETLLRNCISSAQFECERLFFQFRVAKRDLFGRIPDPTLCASLDNVIHSHAREQAACHRTLLNASSRT